MHLNTHTFSLFSPRTPNLDYSFETNSGKPFHYFTYGVACSEVEIDCLTGDHKVRSLQTLVLRGKSKVRRLDCSSKSCRDKLSGWESNAIHHGLANFLQRTSE